MTDSIRKKSFADLGALPPNPRNLPLSGQNGCFGSTTIEALERRIGLRRNATRAPTQAPEWRGRLWPPQNSKSDPPILSLLRPKNGLDKGGHFRLPELGLLILLPSAHNTSRLSLHVHRHIERISRHQGVCSRCQDGKDGLAGRIP